MATYVLVHGAYQGGWIWKPVAQRLRAAGHEVYAPTLEGCAERHDQVRVGITVGTHAHEVARLLFYEDLKDVVLVGTSSGGMVICRVAELAEDRIARLVFVDALALLPGERVADIVNRPNANVVTEMTTAPTRPDAEGRMFADLEPATRAWVLARYTPHPVDALEAPMDAQQFLGAHVEGGGDPLSPGAQPSRVASAPHRRATQGLVHGDGHGALPDGEPARRARAPAHVGDVGRDKASAYPMRRT